MSNISRTAVTALAVIAAGLAGVAQIDAAPSKYEAVTLEKSGTIVGSVTFEGTPPKPETLSTAGTDHEVCHAKDIPREDLVVSAAGGIKWAVASLKKMKRGKAFPVESAEAPIVLSQVGCRFVPHLVLVPAGRTLQVQNNDGVLHNVHVKARRNNPLNKAMPGSQKTMDLTFKRPDRMPVSCDVHSWMKGWIIATDSPYHEVTDDAGAFRIDQVPPGVHTLEIWHETLGKQSREVEVSAGSEMRVDFKMKKKEKE